MTISIETSRRRGRPAKNAKPKTLEQHLAELRDAERELDTALRTVRAMIAAMESKR